MFRDAGLTAVEVRPVGFGASTIYSGIKTRADYDYQASARHCPLKKIEKGAVAGRRLVAKLADFVKKLIG